MCMHMPRLEAGVGAFTVQCGCDECLVDPAGLWWGCVLKLPQQVHLCVLYPLFSVAPLEHIGGDCWRCCVVEAQDESSTTCHLTV